jgi:hypothetical protein
MEIVRKRWVIIKGEEIFCGLARNYQFKPINNIGDTAIKTYLSKEKAESSFKSSYKRFGEELLRTGKVQAIEVIESLVSSK